MASDHDDELDDREMPDESDMDPEGAVDLSDPCPFCGKAVFEDAEICPHCRNFITRHDTTKRAPIRTLGLIVLILSMLVIAVLCYW